MSVASQVDVDMATIRSDRNLPLSTLGCGAASLRHKAANFSQKVMSEVGSTKLFDQLRCEVVGYTSDGGIDFGVVDCVMHDGVVELDVWRRLVEDLKEG